MENLHLIKVDEGDGGGGAVEGDEDGDWGAGEEEIQFFILFFILFKFEFK